MRVSSFLELLDLPLKLTLALLATVTFVARIPAVAAWPGRRYLGQLDLWTERSVAALCSGGFFALAAVSFAMLAWGETFAPRLQGRRLDRWALRAAALGLTFFSADEILEIHEKIGGWLGHSSALSGSAASEGVFKQLTKASLRQVKDTMEYLDAIGFTYTSNTVVQEYNVHELVEIARYLAQRNVRFHNFIVMKLEWGWRKGPGHGVEHKARYADIAPALTEAVRILEDAGKGVNVRYAPYCTLPGLEKNVVGYKQVQLDPYEWRNGTRGGAIEGTPYGGKPFLFYRELDDYLATHPTDVETKPGYNMAQGPPCSSCALRGICDGVDRDYAARHGWDEFVPYAGEPVRELTHFRHANPRPFEMLQRSGWPAPRDEAAETETATAMEATA